MLITKLNVGESLRIGDVRISIPPQNITNNVRVGIEAPREVPVVRAEVAERERVEGRHGE